MAVRKFNRHLRAVRLALSDVDLKSLTTSQNIFVSHTSQLIPAYTDFIISLIEIVKIANANWDFRRINTLFDPSSWPTTESEPDRDPEFPFIFPKQTQLAITAFHDNEARLLQIHRIIGSLSLDHSSFPASLSSYVTSLSEFRAQAGRVATPVKSFFDSRLSFRYWTPQFDPANTTRAADKAKTPQQDDDTQYDRFLAFRSTRGRGRGRDRT